MFAEGENGPVKMRKYANKENLVVCPIYFAVAKQCQSFLYAVFDFELFSSDDIADGTAASERKVEYLYK